jgi:hypothetical protein
MVGGGWGERPPAFPSQRRPSLAARDRLSSLPRKRASPPALAAWRANDSLPFPGSGLHRRHGKRWELTSCAGRDVGALKRQRVMAGRGRLELGGSSVGARQREQG